MSSHSTFSHGTLSERRFVTELESLVGYSGSGSPVDAGPTGPTTISQGSIQATGDSDLDDMDDTPIDSWSDEEDLPYALCELFMPAPRTTGTYIRRFFSPIKVKFLTQ